MPESPRLSAEGIVVGYGGARVVRGASLSVGAGGLNCIVGPNGAGKSTALKAVAGELSLDQGRIMFQDEDVSRLSTDQRVARGLGYVPQVANTFATLTVHENLLVRAYRRRSGVKARVDMVCDLFPDLRPALGRPAGTPSGGPRRTLALSRALMAQPTLLLLGAPTARLAPLVEGQVWGHILAVQSRGIGVVVVEPNTTRGLRHAAWGYVLVYSESAPDG